MNRPRWPFNLANGRPQTIDSIVDGIGQISSQNAEIQTRQRKDISNSSSFHQQTNNGLPQATRSKHDSLFGTIQNDGQLTLEQSICEGMYQNVQ